MFADRKGYNILVIEDNLGDFALVEEFLSDQNEEFILSHAKNFKEAKDKLIADAARFDVILLDLSLPDKTGSTLIKEIIEMSLNVPVIVLTGYSDITFGVKSLSMGVSDYILKDELTPTTLFKSIIYSFERKKTILALEESERQSSDLFHLSPQPMWVYDQESLKFLDINNAAIYHYGYSKEEFLDMTIREISPFGDLNHVMDNFAIATSKLYPQGISIHRKKNGDLIQVDIQSNTMLFKGKEAKIILANDITERLSYISAVETQNEKLREISWIQSHLVRAPVARILGLAQLIGDKKDSGDDREKMLRYLLTSANELDEIIKNITDKTTVTDYNNNAKNDPYLLRRPFSFKYVH
jgi:PAS domain S-box-containing protein